ncbi:hypothetical protein DFQ27_006702, partial [Actinomortierella ambigua]
MSSRPTARAGLRRPDFGPMQHRSFRAVSPGFQQPQHQQQQQQQQHQEQHVIRRRTIVDGSLAHALQESNLVSSSNSSTSRYSQTRATSLLSSQLSGLNRGAGSLAQQQQALSNEGVQDRIQTDPTWRATTTTVASSSSSASTIPEYSMAAAGQVLMDDSPQDPFPATGSTPATPRRSLPRTPRRRSQTPSQTAPRRSSLRALAEADERMRRQSMLGAQRLAPISRSDYSPMNVIRLLSRVPGFAPAPKPPPPSSGRGPIPGSEHWRKLTPKSERTRSWPLPGMEGDQGDALSGDTSASSSSAAAAGKRQQQLSNPFLQNDQWADVTGDDVADEDATAARRRDLTDVSMEYKLGGGGGGGGEADAQESGDRMDGQTLMTTPGGQGALEDGEQATLEDPFDMSWQDARRERSLLASEGDPLTGEMSVGRLSQILGEKAVLYDDEEAATTAEATTTTAEAAMEAAEEDAQMTLDQDVEDQAPGADDQQGRDVEEGEGEAEGAMPMQGDDGWEDIPEGADVLDGVVNDAQEAVHGDGAPDEVNEMQVDVEEEPQNEPNQEGEEVGQQDQQDDEVGWQDEEDQDGARGRRGDNQVVYLDDLPSELGMMSNGQFLSVDKPKGKKSVRMSKKGRVVPSLPISLQRQLVQTFARSRLSREAMEEITEA